MKIRTAAPSDFWRVSGSDEPVEALDRIPKDTSNEAGLICRLKVRRASTQVQLAIQRNRLAS